MEMRFAMEHAEAEIATARKLFGAGDRERCALILEALGSYLEKATADGFLLPPNIDVKPDEPV